MLFKQLFGNESDIAFVKSPGRINLIGEHTDFNEGFVLPAAIDKAVYVAMSKRTDGEIHIKAETLNSHHHTNTKDLSVGDNEWSGYLLGVVQQLQKAGHTISGFNAVVDGDVPVGAGMSSSAAVECATLFALNEIFSLNLDKITMVKMAQKAENEFVGVKCGIMDMFASVFGKKGHVIKLDCRNLRYDYYPLNLNDCKIVLFDTQVKHSLMGGEYNLRRQQCEEGVTALKTIYPEIKNLRDVSLDMVEMTLVNLVPPVIYNRCKYIVEENMRLQTGCELLIRNDLAGFGKKMFETHEGLTSLYEVSCTELDLLVGFAKGEPAILGARMMGGGFGGCTINIIKENEIDRVSKYFSDNYFDTTGLELKTYITAAENGTELL